EVWPIKSKGKIIFVTPERINYQIDAKTGELFAKSYGGRESIGLSPDGKYYFIKNMKDTVRAYKAGEISIGTAQVQPSKSSVPVKWQTITDYGYEIAPTPITCSVGNGKENMGIAFIPTDKGNIYALNISDGSIAWEHRVAGALINYILPIGRNQLLVSTMDGIVTLLEY
ncbi:MAG: PQQ-binding-like beta-propeller repeat protein, partial [Bacteroidales bacterium]